METIAAVATPPGVGALGVVRLSGPAARGIGLAILRLAPDSELAPRRAVLAAALSGGRPVDQVVATFFPGPRSATGEDLLEISCHGSPYILSQVLSAAADAGARAALPGEFTQRAYLNGRLDLAQAEAVCELIRARTEQAHRTALRQLQGGLSQAVAALREPVLDLLVRVEATLDHPEEDLPRVPRERALAELRQTQSAIEALAATFERGRIVAEGARVCLVGPPNAGKSSLLNALLGTDRAIVCPEPGTTRDTLEEPVELEGIASVLIDTAGLRQDGGDPAEAAGMRRTERALDSSDAAVLVVDGSRAPSPQERALHRRLLDAAARAGRPVVAVLNKADLGLRLDGQPEGLAVSAVTREGLPELRRLLARRLSPRRTGEDEGVLVTSLRHRESLRRAARELASASDTVGRPESLWEDRTASHLRQALQSLGEILGEGAPDEVLREIFSRFCVGK